MTKIKCPICRKVSGIYLETINHPLPNQEYDGIGVFCECCGKIGEVDIKIEIKNTKINTDNFIKTNKERIEKELNDAHADWVKNSMGRW